VAGLRTLIVLLEDAGTQLPPMYRSVVGNVDVASGFMLEFLEVRRSCSSCGRAAHERQSEGPTC
jgi:hypothetical protein